MRFIDVTKLVLILLFLRRPKLRLLSEAALVDARNYYDHTQTKDGGCQSVWFVVFDDNLKDIRPGHAFAFHNVD